MEGKSDYLKYWRVIKFYAKVKYKISDADLDMLLFLYSEKYFGKSKFNEFDEILGWDRVRFNKLLKNDWITVFRKRTGTERTLYCLSFKAKKMITSIYAKIEGEEVSEHYQRNPMFKKDVRFTEKVHRNFIKQMNKYRRDNSKKGPVKKGPRYDEFGHWKKDE